MDFGIITSLDLGLSGGDSCKTGERVSPPKVSLLSPREKKEKRWKRRREKKREEEERGEKRKRGSLSGNLSSRLTLVAITDWIKTVISTRIGRVGRACSPLLSESGIR